MGPDCGDGGGGSGKELKRGPWAAAEDAMLTEYVKTHGEGNWNAVKRNSGLMRCGKSCRLRWFNHLRPNLKKGAFTPDEERIVIEHHAKFGNKWSRMAAQLPGRTDNEIKNYWNARMKRHQRAGLPIYPHRLHSLNQTKPISSSSFFSYSLFSSPPPPPPPHNSSFNPYLKLCRDNNGGLALSLSSSPSQFSSSSMPLFNQGIPTDFSPKPWHRFDSLNPRPVVGVSCGLVQSKETELPSIQVTTPTSSMATSEYEVEPPILPTTSGLLEDVLGESQVLTRTQQSNKDNSWAHDKVYTEMKPMDETEEVNLMDENLWRLLDSPDWNSENGDVWSGQ